MVRCKVQCMSKLISGEGTEYETAQVEFSAAYDGSKENEDFFKYTPSASINLQVVNPEAAKQFEQGKYYYLDFTPVE